MQVYQLSKDRVIYNYRYFLPYAPEWGSPQFCAHRLRELLEFCRKARVDAVQFFVNTLPGTYYMPAHNAAEQTAWAKWMKETVAPALRRLGVSYQLNLQMLLGAFSYFLDMRDEYPWDFLVNQHGEETLGCACPLSPKFRQVMGGMLRLWAETEPDIIWIDDDFRMHNHGLAKNGLDFYCFCKRHLKEFEKSSGEKLNRKKLVAAILKPGKPTHIRLQWLDFLGKSMSETAGWIRQEVHNVSPKTRLAQMTSVPDVHAAEGRNWKEFLTALCGNYPPMTRPMCGIYTGTAVPVKDHAGTYLLMGQSIAVLEQIFGPDRMEYGPELENTRFTTWCKSTVNTKYVLVLGQLLGCNQITLSLNDLDGSPINEEPAITPLLKETKPYLQTLADLELRYWKPQGAVFLNDPHSARKVELGGKADMQDLCTGRDWENPLLQSGVPTFYGDSAQVAGTNSIIILDRFTAWLPTEPEIKKILARAVLLDGGAGEVLQQRGFGRYLGVKAGPPQKYGITSEVYRPKMLPGVYASRVPHRGIAWHEIKTDGARTVSHFVDSKNRLHTGSTLFENSLGGRVAIYAGIGDLSPWGMFGSHARMRWLRGILRWLSRDEFPCLPVIPHHGLTVVRSRKNETLIAFANLGTDPLKQLTFLLPAKSKPENVRVLNKRGGWQIAKISLAATDSKNLVACTLPCRLNAFEWFIGLCKSEKFPVLPVSKRGGRQ